MRGREVFIVDAVRTPIGRHGGALAHVRPDDLAATVVRALVDRHPALDPARIGDVVFGDANGAGEDNRDVARMAVLLAGLPTSVPGSAVNRLCGSGMDAVIGAARQIAVGDASIVIAGGVESMSRAPWVLPKPDRPFARDHATAHSTTLGWRLVNPAMPSEWTVPLGEGAEILAERFRIGREAQDVFAAASHRKAAVAWESGMFADEVVPVPGAAVDEGIRADTTPEALARLKPVFRPQGTVTAGNSSPLSDGASALLLADADGLAALGTQPLARVAASGTAAVDPPLFGLGPVGASATALTRAGRAWKDLSIVELNEAFAAQALACLQHWPELDPDRVNSLGGAIALGHPLGCSGARIVGSLAHQLARNGGGTGLATLCIGVGQGQAVVLEH
jgi:acetyl-CoA acetyltransferase family protein